jgi:hypothetical protein
MLLLLAGVEGPVGGGPVDRQERAIQEDVCFRQGRPGLPPAAMG